ncbi:uncharacterized protein LOC110112410 [Dendrobium catenatum]|uniref:uncharacterized protein LOC110112410 n=1 Tax=Dendrobium catenatum TaxID=906689 RepID=UPI0009F6EC86|nr:uncharacterized protein LOC110112410 [Dendrobium catenatum]
MGFFYVPSCGLSGGMVILWKNKVAELSVINYSSQVVIGDLKVHNKCLWRIATVYGSIDVHKRKELWEMLNKHSDEEIPMAIGGDFNSSFAVVKKEWNRNYEGDSSQVLIKKFQKSLKSLFYWSKAKHKDLNNLKEELMVEILELQNKEASEGILSEIDYWNLKNKVNEVNSIIARLNDWWKQRAKVKWLVDGDNNSKFFHAYASARRNSNKIIKIKDEFGKVVEEQNLIEETFFNYFGKKWEAKNCILHGWPEANARLNESDRSQLEADFSVEEVERVLK